MLPVLICCPGVVCVRGGAGPQEGGTVGCPSLEVMAKVQDKGIFSMDASCTHAILTAGKVHLPPVLLPLLACSLLCSPLCAGV